MKGSKEQIENAILFFAKRFGQENNYKAIINFYTGTPKIIEMIVYEMFLQRFNPYDCTDEEKNHYELIHEYGSELKQRGWVTYE